MPYFAHMAVELLADVDLLLLVEAKRPVSFFARPGGLSTFEPETCEIMTLTEPGENSLDALQEIADHLNPNSQAQTISLDPPAIPNGALTLDAVGQVVGRCVRENMIVSDESITCSPSIGLYSENSHPADWLQVTGGGLGQGMPIAIGAAVACPDRKVLALVGDGAAMYTVQSLWTQARENLDVTNVIINNKTYGALDFEFQGMGLGEPNDKVKRLFDLQNPDLNWLEISKGLGVEAMRVETPEDFAKALDFCFDNRGPHLIEAVIS
jgi:acetolactate synthase-1/2/3 large subunit